MSEDVIPYNGNDGHVFNLNHGIENLRLEKVEYEHLNSKQKESYNFQKLGSILADYGYTAYKIFDDYNGADIHAVRTTGEIIRIQLKSRITIDKKYLDKKLYIAFSDNSTWYCYPHDYMFKVITNHSKGANKNGFRSIHYIPVWLTDILKEFIIGDKK